MERLTNNEQHKEGRKKVSQLTQNQKDVKLHYMYRKLNYVNYSEQRSREMMRVQTEYIKRNGSDIMDDPYYDELLKDNNQ